jgi:hypothetical protein
LKSQQGVQSVEVGMRLVSALAAARDPLIWRPRRACRPPRLTDIW